MRSVSLCCVVVDDYDVFFCRHRINTAEFKHVDFLAHKFVVQVVCGHQHTLCRAVDSPSAVSSSNGGGMDESLIFVGSAIGSDVFVWGSGILGQLGIGALLYFLLSLLVW